MKLFDIEISFMLSMIKILNEPCQITNICRFYCMIYLIVFCIADGTGGGLIQTPDDYGQQGPKGKSF